MLVIPCWQKQLGKECGEKYVIYILWQYNASAAGKEEFVDTCRYAYILWVSTRQKRNLQSTFSLSLLMLSWEVCQELKLSCFRFCLFKLVIQSMRFPGKFEGNLDDTFPTSQLFYKPYGTSRGSHLGAPNNTFEHIDWAVFLQVNRFQWRPWAENHIQIIQAQNTCRHHLCPSGTVSQTLPKWNNLDI